MLQTQIWIKRQSRAPLYLPAAIQLARVSRTRP